VTGLSSALDQLDHDIDVATRRFGIRTGLVRGVGQDPRDFAVQAWQADDKANSEKVSSVSSVQVYFGVDGGVDRENDSFSEPQAPSLLQSKPTSRRRGIAPGWCRRPPSLESKT
jgi:hypothetical protein